MTTPKQIVASVPVKNLTTHPDNPRRGNIDKIVESIEHNGWFGTVVAQRSTGRVLAGNHRFLAAKQLGHKTVPVYWVDVDDDAATRIMLADNKTADDAAYDDEVLFGLLSRVDDLDGTGWISADVDLLETLIRPSDEPDVSPSRTEQRISEIRERVTAGDIWQVGDHRVMCGDCRDADDVAALADGATFSLAFTSPPYADRRVYDSDSEFAPIPPDGYVDWFAAVAACVQQFLAIDGSWFVNIKPGVASGKVDSETYVMDLVLAHARQWGWKWVTEFCWERNGAPGRYRHRFKNQFEPIYHFALSDEFKFRPDAVMHPSAYAITADGSGESATREETQGTRDGTTVFDGRRGDGMAYPGNRLPTFAGSHEAWGHPAAFPVGLATFFVQAYSDTGDTVYDPFAGSGSTLLAAAEHDRYGYGMEISPGYCDIVLERLASSTGQTPTKRGSVK